MHRNGIENQPGPAGEKEPDYLAMGAIFLGNLLTDTRPKIGAAMGAYIVGKSEYQSTGLSVATGAVGAGDAGDGFLIRWGKKRLGLEPDADGARRDDLSDKEWAKEIIEALIVRALLDKDYKLALFLLASKTIIDTRDGIITELRDEAQELEVDVRAGPWGKRKTGLQNGTFTGQTSKQARSKRGRQAFYLAQTGATVLSAFSGFVTGRKLKAGIAKAKAEKGLA
jgi:hypothetical protein